MLKLVAGGVALLFTGGIAVIGAQHLAQRSAAGPEWQMMHHACTHETAEGQPQSHVPQHLAEMLKLTAAQIAELDTRAAQACETIARIHAEMLQVLTPEQRAQMAELHGGHGGSGVAEWLRKLHGK